MPGGLHGTTVPLPTRNFCLQSREGPHQDRFPAGCVYPARAMEEFIGATTDKLVQSVLYILRDPGLLAAGLRY